MEAQSTVTERGTLISVLHENGTRASVLLPTLNEGSALSKPLANLNVAAGMLTGIINKNSADYLPTARAKQNVSAVINMLAKPFVVLQTSGQEETRKIGTAKALATAVDPVTSATAPIRTRTLAKWDATDVAGKAAMIQNLQMEGLAALHESGALDDVPSDLRKIATERYIVQRHIAKSGLQADFQRQPDLNNPIATGPDVDAATAFAHASLKRLNGQSEDVTSVADVLRSIVSVAAIVTDLPTERAYQLLATGSIPA